ncbi:MAG TPA: PspC domain-containing protein [Actinomycetes bacterium]|nr:PspC domain-containing protein [Actinomycetes bacterium]
MTSHADSAAPKLYRADSGRVIAGVAKGLAEHLRVDVVWVRVAFIALCFAGGAGVMLYGALWIFVPVASSDQAPGRSTGSSSLLLSIGAIAVGTVVLLQLFDVVPGSATPLVLVVVGAGLLWLRSDEEQRQRLTQRATGVAGGRRYGWAQALVGALLVLVGVAAFLASRGSLVDVGRVLVAGLVVSIGLALLLAPWALGLWRDRDEERRARIRSEERAEIAAHVHDSVLQTLTLIQRNSADPGVVSRLARAQERDLRHWLYEPVPDSNATLRGALESAVAEIEDERGVTIELVCVGDAPLDERLAALAAATREATLNAVKYGGETAPVTVYAEVADDEVTVYVRDRGPGFDLSAVPDDRRGVRDSIIGRMDRNGGQAVVRPLDGVGTSVELRMQYQI